MVEGTVTMFETGGTTTTRQQLIRVPSNDKGLNPILKKSVDFTIPEDKDAPEEYIKNILNPLKNDGFVRKFAELPESWEEREILIKQMNKELRYLRKDVKIMKSLVHAVHPRSFQMKKALFIQYSPKLDQLHMQLSIPIRNRIANLKGKQSTISIPKTSHPPNSYIVKPLKTSKFENCDTLKKTAPPVAGKSIKPDPNEKNETATEIIEEQILHEELNQTILQKMGNFLAKEFIKLIIESSPKRHTKHFTEFPIHRLGFQTIHFMYRNHLITQQDFVSLFEENVLNEAAENMYQSYVYDQPHLFDSDYIEDGKNIFNGWYGLTAREMFSVLQPKQQRMFSFYSIAFIFQKYIKLHDSKKIPELKDRMNYYNQSLFKNDRFFNLLEEFYQQNSIHKLYINGDLIKTEITSISDTFKSVENMDLNGEHQNEIPVLFQIIRFIEENYPDLIARLNMKKDDVFGKKYALMCGSSWFHGQLDNRKIYLEMRFCKCKENSWPSTFEFLPTKNQPMKPLDELKCISSHLDNILSQYEQKVNFILDGDQMNIYCDDQRIRELIQFLKVKIDNLKVKIASQPDKFRMYSY
ncbi:hypothetical protein PGT21_009482 [Puccinia graminis f. sp. tritici]|nr:hypothetical protein PGT21_009482 [Puccinia graminis f. sp. tritici]